MNEIAKITQKHFLSVKNSKKAERGVGGMKRIFYICSLSFEKALFNL